MGSIDSIHNPADTTNTTTVVGTLPESVKSNLFGLLSDSKVDENGLRSYAQNKFPQSETDKMSLEELKKMIISESFLWNADEMFFRDHIWKEYAWWFLTKEQIYNMTIEDLRTAAASDENLILCTLHPLDSKCDPLFLQQFEARYPLYNTAWKNIEDLREYDRTA